MVPGYQSAYLQTSSERRDLFSDTPARAFALGSGDFSAAVAAPESPLRPFVGLMRQS
jgi:hypothetical protein